MLIHIVDLAQELRQKSPDMTRYNAGQLFAIWLGRGL